MASKTRVNWVINLVKHGLNGPANLMLNRTMLACIRVVFVIAPPRSITACREISWPRGRVRRNAFFKRMPKRPDFTRDFDDLRLRAGSWHAPCERGNHYDNDRGHKSRAGQ